MADTAPPSIPGFYYDPIKKKYFKALPNGLAPTSSFLSTSTAKALTNPFTDPRPSKRRKPNKHQKNNEVVRKRWRSLRPESGLLNPTQIRDLERERLVGMWEKSSVVEGDAGGIAGSLKHRIECGALVFGEEWNGLECGDVPVRTMDVVCGTNMNAIVHFSLKRLWNCKTRRWTWKSEGRDVVAMLPGPVTALAISPTTQTILCASTTHPTTPTPTLSISRLPSHPNPHQTILLTPRHGSTIWSITPSPTAPSFALSTDTGILLLSEPVPGHFTQTTCFRIMPPPAANGRGRFKPKKRWESLCCAWWNDNTLLSGNRDGTVSCFSTTRTYSTTLPEIVLKTTGGPVLNLSLHRPPNNRNHAFLLVDSLLKLDLYDLTPLISLRKEKQWSFQPLLPMRGYPLVDWNIKRAEGGRFSHAFSVEWGLGLVCVGNTEGRTGVFSLETGVELGGRLRRGMVAQFAGDEVWMARGGEWNLWTTEGEEEEVVGCVDVEGVR